MPCETAEMRVIMIIDICGWIGMILIVSAYVFISLFKQDKEKADKEKKRDMLYQILNLLGAVFMAIGLLPKNAWFSFALQVVWGLIAIIVIIKIIWRNKKEK